jgi:hypothetical protein
VNGFYSLPKKYPTCIDKTIVDALIKLKEATDAEYPPELYIPTRDAYRAQITTIKTKPGQAATRPGRQ